MFYISIILGMEMERLRVSWMSFSDDGNLSLAENLSRFGIDIVCLFETDCTKISLLLIKCEMIYCDKMIKVATDIRRTIPHIPAIIICHCSSYIRGELLTKGLDDVVSPTIHPIELYARIIGLHKRYDKGQYVKKIGDFHIDYLDRNISHNGIDIPLKPREYLLLEYLIKHSPKPISRTNILHHLWNCRHDPGTNSVEVHIWRLRQKMLEYAPHAPQIQTIKNKGYVIAVSSFKQVKLSSVAEGA